MTMTPQIEAAIRGFTDIILGGDLVLLRQNETAFLSFMCSVAAIDALTGYCYKIDKIGERFEDFIKKRFLAKYASHAGNLYKLRYRLPHSFSPTYDTLVHAFPATHPQQSPNGDIILSDDAFFADFERAAQKFFDGVQKEVNCHDIMNARPLHLEK